MFVALHGTFTLHPWLEATADLGPVPEFLFRDRTASMQWSAGARNDLQSEPLVDDQPFGLWTVSDAGPDRIDTTRTPGPIAWFHAFLRSRPSPATPLPVRPFLTACDMAVRRLGQLHLGAVQLLLPLAGLDPSPRTSAYPRVDGGGWWASSNPADRSTVTIGFDSGLSPDAFEVAPAVVARLNSLNQHVFNADLTSVRHSPPDPHGFALSNHLWPGPLSGGPTFDATIAEYNLDTIGWLGALVADLAVDAGAESPLLMTLST